MFPQINPAGSRLSELARGANMSPQAMGELVDELESMGYVVRRPDPGDRRAKHIVLTRKVIACVEAGRATIEDLEEEITRRLGQRGHHQLRRMLEKLSTPRRDDFASCGEHSVVHERGRRSHYGHEAQQRGSGPRA